LRRILKDYFKYYEMCRTHLSLEKDAPISRPVEPPSLGPVDRDSKKSAACIIFTRAKLPNRKTLPSARLRKQNEPCARLLCEIHFFVEGPRRSRVDLRHHGMEPRLTSLTVGPMKFLVETGGEVGVKNRCDLTVQRSVVGVGAGVIDEIESGNGMYLQSAEFGFEGA